MIFWFWETSDKNSEFQKQYAGYPWWTARSAYGKVSKEVKILNDQHKAAMIYRSIIEISP